MRDRRLGWSRLPDRRLIVYRVLEDGTFWDCLIETGDGVRLSAHLAYLTRSQYFRTAFTSGFKEQDEKIISLPEDDFIIRRILLAIYCPVDDYEEFSEEISDDIADLSVAEILSLFRAADKYMLGPLKHLAMSQWTSTVHGMIRDCDTFRSGATASESQKAHTESLLLSAMKLLEAETSHHREQLLAWYSIFSRGIFDRDTRFKRAIKNACPRLFQDLVTGWYTLVIMQEDSKRIRCPYCGRQWTCSGAFEVGEVVHCMACGKKSSWIQLLREWLVANPLPKKW